MPTSLQQSFTQDKKYLAETALPIVTVTGAFREDAKRFHGLPNNNKTSDILFSRAHFSMPYGLLRQVWKGDEPKPKKAWMVDPTNYVTPDQWRKIIFTEKIGELIARHPILKTLKDLIDQFGRNKLPILESITPPLIELFEDVEKPILSFHIAAGNILLDQGKSVIQVVTDPHIRDDYLIHADNPKLSWCVFDENTKRELLAKTKEKDIVVKPERVIVTGPPVDERIVNVRKKKTVYKSAKRPLRIALTTGGLGTNKGEIKSIVDQLLPVLAKDTAPFQLLIYCGTEQDIFEMVKEQAEEAGVKPTILNQQRNPSIPIANAKVTQDDRTVNLSILHHPQIFDANELLITHAFPWADIFITKPSGDMAYDAVASGSALLTLAPWGVWEERIQEIFEQKFISQSAQVENIIPQLLNLVKEVDGKSCWVEQAMTNAREIDPLFLEGNGKIQALGRGQ